MPFPITDLGGKIIAAVAGASLIGGGTAILDAQRDNAVQDTKIENIAEEQKNTLQALKDVIKETSELNKNVARLIGREEGRRDGR